MQKLIATSLVVVATSCLFSASALAERHRGDRAKTYFTKGKVTNGYNISRGKIMYNLGGIVGAQGFNYAFVYVPGSDKPSIIGPDTPDDALVATGIDQAFYDAIGVDSSVIDPKAVNLPFRQLPITVDGNTADPAKAKATLGAYTAENYKTGFGLNPSEPITIGDWFKARGWSYVKCYPAGNSRATFIFENLVPNGVYGVWGIFGADLNGDGQRDYFAPKPFGGSPNVMTADDQGNATFSRALPFCPNTDPDMMTVEITFHVDGVTYGAVPSVSPTVSTGNSYLSTPTQISFNLGNLADADGS